MAATCVESIALQTAAATKLPGNLQTSVAEVGVARVEQPELGDSTVVSPLVIEPTWLGNVTTDTNLPLTENWPISCLLLRTIAPSTAFNRYMA